VDIDKSWQVDSGGNQDQATDQEELGPQDNDVICPQTLKDDFVPDLPTPDETSDETPETAPAGPFGPLTRRTTRLEAVPEEQMRKNYHVYIDNIVAISRRENVLRL